MKRIPARRFAPVFLVLLVAGSAHAGPASTDSSSRIQVPWQTSKMAEIALEASKTPELSTTCGAQSKIVGSDKAGVITMGPVTDDSWNLGCTITFAEKFRTPACVLSVSGGQAGNGIRIVQTQPESLLFHAYPYKFQGGESVMYICSEATP
jgi:hypothetical protein